MASALEQFQKIPPVQKVFITGLLLILVAVAFYILLYQEVEDSIKKEKSKKKDLQLKYSNYQTQLENKKKFQEDINELLKKKKKALERLPEREDIPELLNQMHGQAQIVGLEIVKFSILEKMSKGFYSAIPISLELRGTFQQLSTFFYYVGKMTRIVNISNLELGSPTEVEDKVVLKVSTMATTFQYSGK